MSKDKYIKAEATTPVYVDNKFDGIRIFPIYQSKEGWQTLFEEESRKGFYAYRIWIGEGEAAAEVLKIGDTRLIRFPGTIDAFGEIESSILSYIQKSFGLNLAASKKEANGLRYLLERFIRQKIKAHDGDYSVARRGGFLTPKATAVSPEKKIQVRLAKKLGGKLEVRTSSGTADIVTSTEVIEVKEASLWKGALGQVITYQLDMPHLSKRIHLFNVPPKFNKTRVEKACSSFDVLVTYEE
jgi:hypothetical protein